MIKKIIIVLLMVLVVLAVVKDKVVEISAEKIARSILGTRLDIGSMKVGVLEPVLVIRDMELYNPSGFRDEIMADIPEIYLRYDLAAILGGTIGINEFRFNMERFDVIKNDNGELNVERLKPVKEKEEGEKIEKRQEEAGELPDMYIGRLSLKVDEVRYKDYSSDPAEPSVQTFDINIDETYEDIDDPYTLVRLILVSALRKTAVSNLIDVPMKGVDQVMQTAQQVSKRAGAVVEGSAETATETAGTAADTVNKTIRKTTETVGSLFKGLGGSSEEK
ncbi:MAG: hypothetical protein GF392_03080 [Candidatus Omnitrophica bacterium]|nr:hypothetical protein [Candidatus Omnitrophota bacterium]